MKKLLTGFCLIGYIFGFSQEKTDVESSITSLQAGILGVWLNNETKIYEKTTLRSELAMNFGFSKQANREALWAFTPSLRLEPKYYYNLERRLNKGKSIDNNSGNFFSLPVTYTPNWFLISNIENAEVIPNISIVPSYGLRRNITGQLNYEFSFGAGYAYYFVKNLGYSDNILSLAMNLSFRLGYTF